VITVRETATGIYAAWRLALTDRDALDWLDVSVSGFWRSFYAALIVLPAYAILVGVGFAEGPHDYSLGRVVVVQGIAYVLDWTAFPLAAFYATRAMGRERHFIRLIVALNWAKVLEAFVMVPAAMLAVAAPAGLLGVLPLAAFLAVLVYHWYVTRAALDVSGAEAVMVVLMHIAIGVMITVWAQALMR
jgi:hypothetical protein